MVSLGGHGRWRRLELRRNLFQYPEEKSSLELLKNSMIQINKTASNVHFNTELVPKPRNRKNSDKRVHEQ
ncbi:hypothetical protein LBBP_03176 [Leptospira borgpetersenii serovar Ballum]|uniref:Uncharacterized protein n=1 Tax=Leptospira borgpetersenii serovar Ballum TaxID=280505 RepID=A0A0S2IV05_LEPBO|nr:hypothetical protein LBBP_03176 [Leptospira borgpetersenii serovar Ballum]